MKPEPIKMIIDTDPGVDDAMAILYAAAASDIDLLGLTTVFGNVTTPIATRNALRLAEMAGLEIPVAEGAHVPQALPPFEPSHWVHGHEGFGRVAAASPSGRKTEESAAEFLVRMAQEHKGELVVCPIGPITNIAEAIRIDPDFTSNCKQIISMAGSVNAGGNITPHAEANTYHDPHAADEVFSAGGDQIMVGLDVTLKILCDRNDFTEIADTSPKLGGFLQSAADSYIDFYMKEAGLNGCSLHDPAAIIAVTHPHYFSFEESAVDVSLTGEEVGRTVAGTSPQKIRWAQDVDAEAVKRLWVEQVKQLDRLLSS